MRKIQEEAKRMKEQIPYIHTYKHTYKHISIRTYIHTYKHTHARSSACARYRRKPSA